LNRRKRAVLRVGSPRSGPHQRAQGLAAARIARCDRSSTTVTPRQQLRETSMSPSPPRMSRAVCHALCRMPRTPQRTRSTKKSSCACSGHTGIRCARRSGRTRRSRCVRARVSVCTHAPERAPTLESQVPQGELLPYWDQIPYTRFLFDFW